MQGANAVLNVLTIPPGASITSPRIVLDGVRGAIFVYGSGGPTGALIGSWAGTAGTDPYSNSYPAGLNVGGFTSGAQIYVQATAPSGTIPVNSLWINTTSGSAETWNGTSWVAQTFNAVNLLQSATISAGLLVAGIVVAGIVNGTTITGSTIIDTGGGYFGYNGTPAAGNLFYSDTDTAGTDSSGNAYLKGVTFYGNPSTGVWIAVNMSVANSAYGPQYYTATSSAGPWSLDSFVSRSSSNAGQLEIGPIVELPSTNLLPATPTAGGKLWTPNSSNTPRVMKLDGESGYAIGEAVKVLPATQTISAGWAVALAAGGVSLQCLVVSGLQYHWEGFWRVVHGSSYTSGDTDRVGATGPTTSECVWFVNFSASATPPASSTVGYQGIGSLTFLDYNPGGASFFSYVHAWGTFIPSANGTFSLAAGQGTGATNFLVEQGTYLKIRTCALCLFLRVPLAGFRLSRTSRGLWLTYAMPIKRLSILRAG